jgi:hypothetical protein
MSNTNGNGRDRKKIAGPFFMKPANPTVICCPIFVLRERNSGRSIREITNRFKMNHRCPQMKPTPV